MNDLDFLRRLAVMKVLVVDDQKNMVKTIENMVVSICAFRRKSESLIRAYDGQEAITALVNQPPRMERYIDLVLLDWNMPRTPGIEVVRAIRSSPHKFVKDVPVIMITGESKARDVNSALYEGVDNYLLKPFLLDDLRTRMNPLLKHYWMGKLMRRAKNRRSEPRYFADRLQMRIEVEFMDGALAPADVVTISQHGLRVDVTPPAKFEVKCLRFHGPAEPPEAVRKVECIAFVPEAHGSGGRVELSLWLKFGFHNTDDEQQWKAWVDAARQKEMEYRSAFI